MSPQVPEYTVLHVVNAVSTGGAQTLIEAMAARRRPGQTLRLVVLAGPDTLSDRLEQVFDSVDYLDFATSSNNVPGLVRELKKVVDRLQPDVVHSHLLHADLANAVLPRGRRARVSTVHTTGMTRDDPLRSRAPRLRRRRAGPALRQGRRVRPDLPRVDAEHALPRGQADDDRQRRRRRRRAGAR